MLAAKCDICGQPAAIHETVIEGDTAVSRHLCLEHGQAAMPTVPAGEPAKALRAAEEQFRQLSEAEKEHWALLYRLTHCTT
jgi:hypothetical protein